MLVARTGWMPGMHVGTWFTLTFVRILPAVGLGLLRLEREGGRQGLPGAGLRICIPRRSQLHQYPQGLQTKEGPKLQVLSLEDADSVGVEMSVKGSYCVILLCPLELGMFFWLVVSGLVRNVHASVCVSLSLGWEQVLTQGQIFWQRMPMTFSK